MLSLKTCLMNIIKNIKTLNTWKSETVDYIVEKGTIGTNDAYNYVKYNSGLCLCRGGGYYPFSSSRFCRWSNYEPEVLKLFLYNTGLKYKDPRVWMQSRYLGDDRTAGLVFTPDQLWNGGGVYVRQTSSSTLPSAGSYYVDTYIQGYWK